MPSPPRAFSRALMISLSKVSKQYGRQLIFVDASFQLNPGEKAGLVGPNGAGKTTLFRLIVGEESPDEGEVSVPKKVTIGYFRQDIEEMSGRSVLDEAIAGSGRLGDLHHELMDLEHAMTDVSRPDYDQVLTTLMGKFYPAGMLGVVSGAAAWPPGGVGKSNFTFVVKIAICLSPGFT